MSKYKDLIDVRDELGEGINNFSIKVLSELDRYGFSNNDKETLKSDIVKAMSKKLGTKNYSEIKLSSDSVSELADALSDNKDKVSEIDLQEVDISNITDSLDDLIINKHLDRLNVNCCLVAMMYGKIPVLVGHAGIGKTHTAKNIAEIIYKEKTDSGCNFSKMYKVFIPCSNISYNDFWGSCDAVSHKCIGKFKYVWREAKNNPDTLYYVILDELLDMRNIRETFGDSFQALADLPNNIVIVGTGNDGELDLGGETSNKMTSDSGIMDRFELIKAHNILSTKDGMDYFFGNLLESATSLQRRIINMILNCSKEYEELVLVPRRVVKMVNNAVSKNISEDDYLEVLEFNISKNNNYIVDLLFIDRPDDINRESRSKIRRYWNAEE